jgi:hypothetical protein
MSIERELQAQIEQFLLEAGDWVPGEVLAARFMINERHFRADGKIPGLVSKIAIFSCGGLKHLRHSTVKERLACKHRLRKEIISRVRRERWLQEGTRNCLNGQTELHTGQDVLPL